MQHAIGWLALACSAVVSVVLLVKIEQQVLFRIRVVAAPDAPMHNRVFRGDRRWLFDVCESEQFVSHELTTDRADAYAMTFAGAEMTQLEMEQLGYEVQLERISPLTRQPTSQVRQ